MYSAGPLLRTFQEGNGDRNYRTGAPGSEEASGTQMGGVGLKTKGGKTAVLCKFSSWLHHLLPVGPRPGYTTSVFSSVNVDNDSA